MTIKIAVAEPSVIIRSGVLTVLKRLTDIHMEVFEIGDARQVKEAVSRCGPDILIINPSFAGDLSLQQLRKEGPGRMKCVALQSSLADAAALKSYDEVISVYDSSEQIKDKLTALISRPEEDRRHESLSAREKEVVVCVIKGMTNKQIADTLCLSAHTVMTHRRNISAKLQIHSTAGLTIYAIVNKLVDLDDVKDVAEAGDL